MLYVLYPPNHQPPAQLIQLGEFQMNGDEGAIVFPLASGDKSMWRMIKNENGIWQSGFLPLQ